MLCVRDYVSTGEYFFMQFGDLMDGFIYVPLEKAHVPEVAPWPHFETPYIRWSQSLWTVGLCKPQKAFVVNFGQNLSVSENVSRRLVLSTVFNSTALTGVRSHSTAALRHCCNIAAQYGIRPYPTKAYKLTCSKRRRSLLWKNIWHHKKLWEAYNSKRKSAWKQGMHRSKWRQSSQSSSSSSSSPPSSSLSSARKCKRTSVGFRVRSSQNKRCVYLTSGWLYSSSAWPSWAHRQCLRLIRLASSRTAPDPQSPVAHNGIMRRQANGTHEGLLGHSNAITLGVQDGIKVSNHC